MVNEKPNALEVKPTIMMYPGYYDLKDKVGTLFKAYRSSRDVYLLFHHSIRDSKLANNLYKLNVSTTVRNWKTLSKLATLAKAMEI